MLGRSVRFLRNLQTSASARITTADASSGSTVNPSEVAHFSRLSSLWWDEHGEFKLLHRMNPVRMQFLREKLTEVALDEQGEGFNQDVFKGLDVLDVGCGGGLLSEVSASSKISTELYTFCPCPRALHDWVQERLESTRRSRTLQLLAITLRPTPNCRSRHRISSTVILLPKSWSKRTNALT
jgi:hypothetical protein